MSVKALVRTRASSRYGGETNINRREARRTALIEAATAEFMAKGYEAATLSDIIGRAGGSRSTIYKEFGDKAGLFRAVTFAQAEAFRSLVDDLWAMESDIRQTLFEYARAFVGVSLQPINLALFRIGITEAARFPELSRSVVEHNETGAIRTITNYLARLNESGRLFIPDPPRAAEMFLVMIRGNFQVSALVDPANVATEKDLDRYVSMAVEAFIKSATPA